MSYDNWRFTFGRRTKAQIDSISYSNRSAGMSVFNDDIKKPEYVYTPQSGSTFIPINISINGGSTIITGTYPGTDGSNSGYSFFFNNQVYLIIYDLGSNSWKIYFDTTINLVGNSTGPSIIGSYTITNSSFGITQLTTSIYEDRSWTNEDCVLASCSQFDCQAGRIVQHRLPSGTDATGTKTGLICESFGANQAFAQSFYQNSSAIIGVVYRDNIPSIPTTIFIGGYNQTMTWDGITFFNDAPVYTGSWSSSSWVYQREFFLGIGWGWQLYENGSPEPLFALYRDSLVPAGYNFQEAFTAYVGPTAQSPKGAFRQIATQGLYSIKFGPDDTSCTRGKIVFADQYNWSGFATQIFGNVGISVAPIEYAVIVGSCAVTWNSTQMTANNNMVPCFLNFSIINTKFAEAVG